MTHLLTKDAVARLVRARIAQAGTQRAAATVIGVSPTVLSRAVRLGEYTAPLLARLGLRKVTRYEVIPDGEVEHG